MWHYLLLLCAYLAQGSLADYPGDSFCDELNPQPYIDVPQLFGMWHAVEIIDHKEVHHYNRTTKSCPFIQISKIPPPYINIVDNMVMEGMLFSKIYWNESGKLTRYFVKWNVTQPGFWISSEPEIGTFKDPKRARDGGVIQIIKAAENHLVLTFCMYTPGQQLYSVLFSKERKLDSVNTREAHMMLNQRALPTNAVKKLCTNGSSPRILSISLCLLIILSSIYKTLNFDELTRID